MDKEANAFFQNLYREEMLPEVAVERSSLIQNLTIERRREVINGAMHILFDKYCFFLKYPDSELKITGICFGSVTQHFLTSEGLLLLPMRCVLNAHWTSWPMLTPIGRNVKFVWSLRLGDDSWAAAGLTRALNSDSGDISTRKHHTFGLFTRRGSVSVWAAKVFIRVTYVRIYWRTRELSISMRPIETAAYATRRLPVTKACSNIWSWFMTLIQSDIHYQRKLEYIYRETEWAEKVQLWFEKGIKVLVRQKKGRDMSYSS